MTPENSKKILKKRTSSKTCVECTRAKLHFLKVWFFNILSFTSFSHYFHDFEKHLWSHWALYGNHTKSPLNSSQIVVSSIGFYQEGLALSSWRQNTIPTPSFFSLKAVSQVHHTRVPDMFLAWSGTPRFSVQQVCGKQLVTWKMEGSKTSTNFVDYDRNFDMWHVQSWRSQERNILPSKDKGKSSSKVPLKGDMLVSWSIGFFQHPFNITPITTLWAHDVSTSPGVCKHEPTMIRSKHLA